MANDGAQRDSAVETGSSSPSRNGEAENVDTAGFDITSHNSKTDTDLDLEKAAEQALLRKIDLHLIPYLTFLYLLSFLCRTNIGNARIEGLVEDLNMTDQEYLWTLSVFFVSYALCETPSNILLKKLKPSVWFPSIILAWGSCMTFMGLVRNFGGLVTCRLILGIGEAGLFPGVAFYLSCWYKKREYGLRAAIFASASSLSGAFGGLLAAAIARMDGIGNRPGWAWIFIIEGLVTVVAGIASFWLIQDFPESAKFLSPSERKRVLARLHSDAQRSAGRAEFFRLDRVWTALKDWKTGLGMLVYMGTIGPIQAFALFLPTIIKDLGHQPNDAQLLTVPPYILASLTTVAVGFAADSSGKRARYLMLCLLISITGYTMNLVPATGPTVRYVGVYLAAMGLYPCVSNTVAWVSNNVEGSYQRSIVMALVLSNGNLQGVVSARIYRARDAPHYILGHAIGVAYLVLAFASAVVFALCLDAENRSRDLGERNYRIRTGTEEEALELGDQHPDFRYTI